MADFKTQQITFKSLGTNIPTEKAEIILLYFSSIALIHRCATELYCILGRASVLMQFGLKFLIAHQPRA